MLDLAPTLIQCPYCWESIEVLVDTSVEEQVYTEDCSVCCHPILLTVFSANDEVLSIETAMDE